MMRGWVRSFGPNERLANTALKPTAPAPRLRQPSLRIWLVARHNNSLKWVYVAVDNDEKRAESRLNEWFGKRYGNADMASQVAVWGSAAKCTEELAKITEAGAEMVLLNPAFDDMEHLEVLAKEVIPNI